MIRTNNPVKKQNFLKRVILTPAPVFILFFAALNLHDNLWRYGLPPVTRIGGHISFFIFLICYFFGAFYVYPKAYFRGAGPIERIFAGLVTPVTFIVYEIVRVSEFFTLGESVYYGFSTIGLLPLTVNIGFMGLAEMICRARVRRLDYPIPIVTPLSFFAFALLPAGVYVMFIWGMGTHWFYIYQEGYKFLFH